MTALWRTPRDPSIHADITMEAGPLLRLQETLRDRGHRVTPTAIILRACGYVHDRVPEFNVVMRWGRMRPRKEKDAWLYTSDADGRVLGRRMADLNRRDVVDIQRELDQLGSTGEGNHAHWVRRWYRAMGALPMPLLRLALSTFSWWAHNVRIGGGDRSVARHGWSSVGITNIGSLGFDRAPIIPVAPLVRHVAMLSIGRIHKAPVVRGDELAVAPVLPMTITLDHRAIVGTLAVRMAKEFMNALTNDDVLNTFLPMSGEKLDADDASGHPSTKSLNQKGSSTTQVMARP